MNAIKFFSFTVGIWNEDGSIEAFFADVEAGSKEAAIAMAGADGVEGVDAMPIHFLGDDGVEYDYR